jgi:peptidoglycan/LPS O-acetylase OafA/YrhL
MLSNISFGMYLIHPLMLMEILRWAVPTLAQVFPAALSMLVVWALTTGGAAMISVILLNIPVVSHLVGRSHASLPNAALRDWLDTRLGSIKAPKRLPRSGDAFPG